MAALKIFFIGLILSFFSMSSTAHADVNNFYFESFKADYYLSKDNEDRSVMQVKEELVAVFPDLNQNRGIERAIPKDYDGHSVSLEIVGVTRSDGSEWNYTTYTSNDNTVIRIGDANSYVQGRQTYVISYSLRDVTKNFDDGDEFYWDVNGSGWAQTFVDVEATLHLDNSIEDSFNGEHACFTGVQGSTNSDCTITTIGSKIKVTSNSSLDKNENLSMVIGFRPETFTSYSKPPISILAVIVMVLLAIVALGLYVILPVWLMVWAYKKWRHKGRDTKKQHVVVPQYLPPKHTSMLVNDVVVTDRMSTRAVTATIIDLAVRRYLKIFELTDKKDDFNIKVVRDLKELADDDKAVLQILYGKLPIVGDVVTISKLSKKYKEVTKLGLEAYDKAIAQKYMVDTKQIQKRVLLVGIVCLIVSLMSFNVLLLVAGVVMLIVQHNMPARTDKGVELKTYLDGTKMYMEVAEAERYKLLQSPDSAVKIDVNDKEQLIKLYERLLPLAVLYGVEKKWAEKFAKLYTAQNQPGWYQGNYGAFNAALFASSLSRFNTATVTNFSPSQSSGSSGFSGGGFSGGGGGGGGGGGW